MALLQPTLSSLGKKIYPGRANCSSVKHCSAKLALPTGLPCSFKFALRVKACIGLVLGAGDEAAPALVAIDAAMIDCCVVVLHAEVDLGDGGKLEFEVWMSRFSIWRGWSHIWGS